jgi:hypothetical protein
MGCIAAAVALEDINSILALSSWELLAPAVGAAF